MDGNDLGFLVADGVYKILFSGTSNIASKLTARVCDTSIIGALILSKCYGF
jgi:hypothetical protein